MTSLKESLNEAASKLGKVGGSRNTPAQLLARQRNAALARAAKHPTHYKKPTAQVVLNRFMSRVVEQPNGCWLWTGAKKPASQGGYAMFRDSRKKSPEHAHAWAYENIRGLPAPKRGSGLELSHTCKTGSRCVNPSHVIPENHTDNIRRSLPVFQRAAANARKHIKAVPKKTHCLRGHAKTPESTYRGGSCKECRRARRKAVRALPTLKICVGSVTAVAENTQVA